MEIAAILGVSLNFVRSVAGRLGLLKSNAWLYAHNLPLLPENPLEREIAVAKANDQGNPASRMGASQ